MTELTEEQKYARKAEMLKRALAAADEMDKRDAVKAVLLPFLVALTSRIYAACLSFMAGVIPPRAILGRSLLYVHS
ncbi:MAG: hypothetical protein RBQ99_10595, partial [Trichlorobacter sp.]|nr:hypothetical protein [Trichlorobacter sp.]